MVSPPASHDLSPRSTVLPLIVEWYDHNARDLPWRQSGISPWAVLVSEVMLQQTPVSRVLPIYQAWMERWPTPSELAVSSPGEAVRAWGRLGYPRRALRLHAAATACALTHGGRVPTTVDELRQLPGVGEYTAAAVAVFAFGQRHAALDTNIRRVHARIIDGRAFQRPAGSTVAERRRVLDLLPLDPLMAAHASVAMMELGAVVCTARAPRCGSCPAMDQCAWRAVGNPPWQGPKRRGQPFVGTDRQCRGRLLAIVRDADGPVELALLAAAWDDDEQRERALRSLIADGLVQPTTGSSRAPAQPRVQLPA